MRVALTGATGFVCRAVARHLIDRGHGVRALVRQPDRLACRHERLEPVRGDLFNPDSLQRLLSDAQAVIHLVGIIDQRPKSGQTFDRIHRQATRRLLDAAGSSPARRWVHMSALGTRQDAVSDYHRTKWLAEQAVRESPCDWTIFRPSLIHGPDGEFMRIVRGLWEGWLPPFMPYFASGWLGTGGGGRVQPVWVEDVARCFADAVDNPASVRQTYAIGGPEALTWPQLYTTCKQSFPKAKPKPILPLPAWLAGLMARLPGVPFNRDQVIMSQEDSVCDTGPVERDFRVKLSPFKATLAQYASAM